MGLIARKNFIGNEGRQYKAGDPCDEALRWKYTALRACLNQGIIEDTTGDVEKHFGLPNRLQLSIAREDRAIERGKIEFEANKKAATSSDLISEDNFGMPVEETAAIEEASIATATSSDESPQDLVLSQQPTCSDCGRSFGTPHALKVHRKRSHRE